MMNDENNQVLISKRKDNPLRTKSFRFSINIVNLYKHLINQQEFVLSKQLVRCGTSIGANIFEAQRAQSVPDFTAKMYIALKEAQETIYWLMLLKETNYIDEKTAGKAINDCEELIKMLTATTKKVAERKFDNRPA